MEKKKSCDVGDAIAAVDPTEHLPLRILGSEIVPPAPSRSRSSIDWLPDFFGRSWIAYGASTTLVISHLPSPLSGEETVIGPIFRQVLEVSADVTSPVTVVSWSPVMPSVGEVAAASGNSIFVFSNDSTESDGYFCWSQNAKLVQATKVEAIGWTGSGDGIISGGNEVVLWRRRNRAWEIAWKFNSDQAQNLVSSTWSNEGPFATAASFTGLQSSSNHVSNCVLACYSDGKSRYEKVELRHPRPISMMHWRPQTGQQVPSDGKHSMRNVLLTCCLDGTVRLWCEIDDGKGRKVGKEVNHQKTNKKSFCVAAVIEINQALNGTLGKDIYLTWAKQIGGILKNSKGISQFFSAEGYGFEKAGRCEWLISFGPAHVVSLWSIHCLDDFSPMRLPRVTLWKRQELKSIGVEPLCLAGLACSTDQLLIEKVVSLRNCLSGPPLVSSFIHLLPSNTVLWSFLSTNSSSILDDRSSSDPQTEEFSPYLARGVLDLDGHSGKILQVAFHPTLSETELAISLDSNALLLLWSRSSTLDCAADLPTSVPSLKLCGQLGNRESCSKYTSLCWAPSTLENEQILLMGHVGGVDCFIVRISQRSEDGIQFHYTCTIPFTDHDSFEDGPTSIFSIPMLPTCCKTFRYNRFMLLGVWMKEKIFKALSWEVSLHHYELLTSKCECNFEDDSINDYGRWVFEDTVVGRRYYFSVNWASSEIPEPHNHNSQVTCFAVVCPSRCSSENNVYSKIPSYTMATGQSDGSLKLWKSTSQKLSTSHIPWELSGIVTLHQDPVTAISLTDCGRKIATFCIENLSAAKEICIWDAVYLIDTGALMLEDSISLGGDVLALRWLSVGDGQYLLGVCTRNEIRVYAQGRSGGHPILTSKKRSEEQIWYCIGSAPTFSAIHDFLWGPKTMAVIVHEKYFSICSQFVCLTDKKQQIDKHPNFIEDKLPNHVSRIDSSIVPAVFANSGISQLRNPPTENGSQIDFPVLSVEFDTNVKRSSCLPLASAWQKFGSDAVLGIWTIQEIAEKLMGPLPLYHPQALLTNIYSGNWKRAHAALKHLVEYLESNDVPEKDHDAESAHFIPEVLLSKYYDGHLLNGLKENGFHWNAATYNMESYASGNSHCSSLKNFGVDGFLELLQKSVPLACTSSIEKMQIVATIDLLNEISNPGSTSVYANLDEPGRRFWVSYRLQQLYFARKLGRTASIGELVVDSSTIGWAFHSDCQDTLFDSVLRTESLWLEMRSLGVGFWYTNAAQLRSKMEKLARQLYLKNKNPRDCALLYVALNRVQVLAGLFKISKDEKDKPLVGFLSRNFKDEKNKAAALKNAYVLMGKHQLEMAIAFFLLGGDTSSAVNVCVKILCDEQLALVISRLVEGQGGPIERHLISKFLLPSAVQRGDFWLASILEWELGEYTPSFLTMTGCQSTSTRRSFLSSTHVSFLDPSIGLYCIMLSNKNSMKNAIGERSAAALSRWATLMAAIAFNRCGLPLEALEILSLSSGYSGKEQAGISTSVHLCNPHGILLDTVSEASNWLSGSVASSLDTHARLDFALQFLSKVFKDHPGWPIPCFRSDGATALLKDFEIHQYEKVLGIFQEKLQTAVEQFDQRFSLSSSFLISLILSSLCKHGLVFIGFNIEQSYDSSSFLTEECRTINRLFSYRLLQKSILKAIKDVCYSLTRFIATCSISCLQFAAQCNEVSASLGVKSSRFNALRHYFWRITSLIRSLKASIRLFLTSSDEDRKTKLIALLDLVGDYMRFAIAWIQGDLSCLFQMVQPLIGIYADGHAPVEVDMLNVKKVDRQETTVDGQNKLDAGVGSQVSESVEDKQAESSWYTIPEDERWRIIGACIWKHLLNFMEHKLSSTSIQVEDGIVNGVSPTKGISQLATFQDMEYMVDGTPESDEIIFLLTKSLRATLAYISSHYIKQLAFFLKQKSEKGIQVPTLLWLKEVWQSQHQIHNQDLPNNDRPMNLTDETEISRMLWNTCVDPHSLNEAFLQEKIEISNWLNLKPSTGWDGIYKEKAGGNVNRKAHNHEGRDCNGSSSSEAGSPTTASSQSSQLKDTAAAESISLFQNPKELFKRTGELIEALCVNTINQRQAAIATNRKGIIFFNWEDGGLHNNQLDYIWSDADWPRNGWAGSESVPVPTCVSLGIGLGSKKGAHLGLGGATVGGALRGSGFSGSGSSGLGWGTQEEFEQFVDPPPTVETIRTKAFSSHPSMPLFLVGSNNTHVYLWEFGKDRATATYGVLPAANVPPPYALASISAVEFGPCGHRFSSAALDGTVCIWQLEVGGRSNIRPVESSLCFNNHASDVSYISSSGSIIAASGYSSNGVNVVIWDTLAPPTTSQASIVCHEGGARSISVFDNDIGSGSISPIIVTGGKHGDVGVHDFRYIATGKTKRQRSFNKIGTGAGKSSSNDAQAGGSSKQGDQNQNGMIWYIPKAHLEAVTKVSTIPNTSLFLTGSKDGDVKLWDAKAAKLVHHWPKLHERHTFMQSSSKSYGGIIRAGVTDIQVCAQGFLSCGGDSTVKFVGFNEK